MRIKTFFPIALLAATTVTHAATASALAAPPTDAAPTAIEAESVAETEFVAEMASRFRAFDPAMAALMAYAEHAARVRGVDMDKEAAAPDAPKYRLVDIAADEVDRRMPIADGRRGLPAVFQGLWWMDGNPLPDEVLTFGASPWNPETRTTSIVVYDENVWTWHPNPMGRALYAFVRKFKLVYELQVNEQLDFAVITPILHIGGVPVRVPESIVKFTARLVADGLWLRESYFFGNLAHTYALRRIVSATGQRERAFDDYLETSPSRALVPERIR